MKAKTRKTRTSNPLIIRAVFTMDTTTIAQAQALAETLSQQSEALRKTVDACNTLAQPNGIECLDYVQLHEAAVKALHIAQISALNILLKIKD